jgi:HAD superfamily hydrolase (TIGR01484 family)
MPIPEQGLKSVNIRPLMSASPKQAQMQAVVTDLDGTLLRSDGTVSDFTVDVLTRLRSQHIRLIFATARPIESATRITSHISWASPVIYSNGAAVYDPLAGKTLRTQVMRNDDVREIVGYIRERFPRALIAVDNASGRRARSLRTVDPDWPEDWGAARGDRALWRIDTYFPPPRSVTCLMVLKAWESHLEVPQIWPVTVTSSGHGLIEFSAPTASKISALRWLCSRLGLSLEATLAFGDMPNDAAVLEACGLGVAVANAHEQVRAAAHQITESNDDDGVAHFLERLLRL